MSTVQKTMDAVITTGEYTDQQGIQKKRYMNIGTLFVYNDGGMSLKLDAVPVGNGNISFYDKKPKAQGHATGGGMNNPSSQQQSQYNQQQGTPAQHLPNQNQNTQGNGYQQQGQQQQQQPQQQGQQQQQGQPQYDQGQPVYDQDGQVIPI